MRRRPGTRARPRPRLWRAPPRARPRRLPASGDSLLPPVPRIPQGLSPLHPRWFAAARRGAGRGRRRLAHRPHRDPAGGRHRICQGAAKVALVARRRAFRARLAAVSAALPRSPAIADGPRRAYRQSLLPVAEEERVGQASWPVFLTGTGGPRGYPGLSYFFAVTVIST